MIEYPHLMQTLGVLFSLSAILVSVLLARGKASADTIDRIKSDLSTKAPAEDLKALAKKLDDRASNGRVETTEARVGKAEDRIGKVEDRVSRIDARLEQMPDRDASHRLEIAIARIEGRIDTMDERLKPIAEMAARAHERMFEEVAR